LPPVDAAITLVSAFVHRRGTTEANRWAEAEPF